MGSGSSKDKETSDGKSLRPRPRRPDFEEEILDDDNIISSPPERNITTRPTRRSSSVISTSNSEAEYFSHFHKNQSAASRGKGHNVPKIEPKVRDPEVEAAIAELEETFRVLDGNSSATTQEEDGQSRSHSCGPLTLNNNNNNVETEGVGQNPMQQGNNPKGVPNKGGGKNDINQNGRVVENGRRNRHGTEGQYGRRLHPVGLTHLPRGQVVTSFDGGANSAPPGVTTLRDRSDSEDWNYKLPKIEGFDIEKFREVNGKNNIPIQSISLRLPGVSDDDYLSRPKAPSYTKDEMELFAKLEREVY